MGGFADGLNAGANMALSAYSMKMNAEDRQRRNERQDKQWAREDATQSAIDKANQAARTAFDQHRSEFEAANQPKTSSEVTLMQGGVDQPGLSLPAPAATSDGKLQLQSPEIDPQAVPGINSSLSLGGPAIAPIPTKQVTTPARPYDEREGVLAGLTARRRALADNGADYQTWGKAWTEELGLRNELRDEKIKTAKKRFDLTGDFASFAKDTYGDIADGYSITDVKPMKSLDGTVGWSLTRRNDQNGEELKEDIPQWRANLIAAGIVDPIKLAHHEFQAALAEKKARESINVNKEHESAKQGTAKLEHDFRLDEIAAQGREVRRTKGMVSGDKRVDANDAGARPRDLIAAIDSERKDIRDRQQALFREYTQELKDASDIDQKASLKAAYDNQVRDLNLSLGELDKKRKQVDTRLGLSSQGGNESAPTKPGLSTNSGKKTTPTISGW